MNFNQLLSLKGEVGQRDFIIWGIILFAAKYNLDRIIALWSNRDWYIFDYYVRVDEISSITPETEDFTFYSILLLSSIPFLWAGTILCMKRMRDVSLSPALVLLFFIPYLNFILFIVLSALPAKSTGKGSTSNYLKGIVPRSKMGSALISVGIAVIVTLIFSFLFVEQLGNYGWSLLVGLPFLMGFLVVFLFGSNKHISLKETLILSLLCVALFSAIIFILAFEGILCLVMGFPILFLFCWIGAIIAFAIQDHSSKLSAYSFSLLFVVLLGIYEGESDVVPPLYSVTTEINIDADRQTIWNELVAFSEIEEPEEPIFKTGIAYPTYAEIEGSGVEAIRKCHFTTGYFEEPITIWDEPKILRFDVAKQPPPMTEWSIYDNLNLPHLDGYFKSYQGQFELQVLSNSKTLLKGTTWYKHSIWPGFYWRIWSDYILHRIHFRVLNHIKTKSENK